LSNECEQGPSPSLAHRHAAPERQELAAAHLALVHLAPDIAVQPELLRVRVDRGVLVHCARRAHDPVALSERVRTLEAESVGVGREDEIVRDAADRERGGRVAEGLVDRGCEEREGRARDKGGHSGRGAGIQGIGGKRGGGIGSIPCGARFVEFAEERFEAV
jgi:hypothetical protein